jgi:hypothetical protein
MPGDRPYFPNLMVDGALVGFAHLEPFQFVMATEGRPGGAVIDVRFSNHCFSEGYDAALHPNPVDVWDRGRRRVFDQARYDLSLGLPAIIAALPNSHVHQTPEANFVRIAALDGGAGEYRVYFNVRKGAPGTAHDLSLFVESAYCPDPATALRPARMTKVRFKLLVDKVLRGKRPRFHHKR